MPTPIPANSAPLTALDAAAATRGRLREGPGGRAPVVARGITSDSRCVVPGSAFVALRGERHDGHAYLDAVLAAGAVLVVVQEGRVQALPPGADLVEVDDTLVAWGDLGRAHVARWRAADPGGRVVAITGSAGKTTTKELCAALLSTVGPCHATVGNLNNRVGVPATAFGLGPEHRYAAFEIGMSVRGEIAELARILGPDVGVVTNVGVAHAEGVGGSRADVAREKGALFEALPAGGVAVACFDDAAAMDQLRRTRARRVVTFGVGAGADYRLEDRVPAGAHGARLRIALPRGRRLDVVFPMVGEAAAVDLVGAIAAAEATAGELPPDAVHRAVAQAPPVPGRMQVRELCDGTTVLDDTYNANPQSMRAALRALAEVAAGRRAVVVVGEMRELGEIAPAEHEALGGALVESRASVVVSCGGLADLAVAAAERAGAACARAADAAEASVLVAKLVRPRDVVLVKASRGVGAERVVDALSQQRGVRNARTLERSESSGDTPNARTLERSESSGDTPDSAEPDAAR
ncbi:MAG TPA: UDP-N-acetylmuramoyl-tripeptide--D-alanyl-D-alanine ligase [Polyangiaceae bacterium]|nr:UDP-N-acetylmuramoyl-tripeptide--D-alanyl-D-alanine ligase [Polyangiaceae bacterium]